jgi:hypothetical protein
VQQVEALAGCDWWRLRNGFHNNRADDHNNRADHHDDVAPDDF